jgi:hypothetical protein
MSTPTKRLSLEDQYLLTNRVQPPILNTNQSTGKYHWIIASIASFGATGGVGYLSIKNFVSGSGIDGGILGGGALICAGACAYCVYRFVDALRTRSIEIITPNFDEEAAKTNTTVLRLIHSRLNTLLNESTIIDLEMRTDDAGLPDLIYQQINELELMLPDLRQQLADLQETIQTAINNKSMESRSGSAFNSPSHESSYEYGILGKLNALSKQVGTDQKSRSASRLQSTYTSPMGGGTVSKIVIDSNESPKGRRINFGIINESDDDSNKELK